MTCVNMGSKLRPPESLVMSSQWSVFQDRDMVWFFALCSDHGSCLENRDTVQGDPLKIRFINISSRRRPGERTVYSHLRSQTFTAPSPNSQLPVILPQVHMILACTRLYRMWKVVWAGDVRDAAFLSCYLGHGGFSLLRLSHLCS